MIKLIAVGKIKEKYIQDGILEYTKRMQKLGKLEIIEVAETNTSDIFKNLEEEGKTILKQIREYDFVVTLEIAGKQLTSNDIAKMIDEKQTYVSGDIVFIIGGSNGLHVDVQKRSDLKLSFGNVTFPHQWMRLLVVEQIYRAHTILHNISYHK